MVKRYGFGLFGEFTEQREGTFVLHRDYDYLKQELARCKAETIKNAERIAELNAQCAAKDSVIATYESAQFGVQRSQDSGKVNL